MDKKSVVLFTLILVVCALFVANSATAAIRGRRRELGVLACVGWTRPRLFATVLGELAAIGLAAGVLGAAAALPLSAAQHLHASPGRALLAVPVAVAVAVTAGAAPAWLAARTGPLASVRPAVLAVRREQHPRGITTLAVVNVRRSPGRDEHKMTIVLASHDPQIAARSERLIRLRDGAVVDNIDLADSYPVEDVIRRAGQLG